MNLIERYEDEIANLIPPIPEVVGYAMHDLYHGPLYFRPEGPTNDAEQCDSFDKGAVQFDFVAACDVGRDWLDEIPTIYVDDFFGCVGVHCPEDDPDYEGEPYYMVEPKDIAKYFAGEVVNYF